MTGTSRTNPQLAAAASRRQILRLTGAGIGWVLGGFLSKSGRCAETEALAQHCARTDVGEKKAEIIEKAYRLGYDYEKQHGG